MTCLPPSPETLLMNIVQLDNDVTTPTDFENAGVCMVGEVRRAEFEIATVVELLRQIQPDAFHGFRDGGLADSALP